MFLIIRSVLGHLKGSITCFWTLVHLSNYSIVVIIFSISSKKKLVSWPTVFTSEKACAAMVTRYNIIPTLRQHTLEITVMTMDYSPHYRPHGLL